MKPSLHLARILGIASGVVAIALAGKLCVGQDSGKADSAQAARAIWKCGFVSNEKLPRPFVQLGMARKDGSTLTAFVGNFNKDVMTRKPLLIYLEGADVAAAVTAQDDRVTHVAYLSGGGAAQFFDFFVQTRKRLAKEGASPEEVETQIAGLEEQIREILADPESETKMFAGHAYKRWSTFATVAAADNLAAGKAKLFLAHGVEDESVPIESFDQLVVDLLRKGRQNVTVRRYPGCDHSYIRVGEEPSNDPFQKVIGEVIAWAGAPASDAK